jgi:2-dehydropantoate 2-reductase
MKIAIIGAGAVGGYFGAKLVQAGYDVTFLARGKQLQAMKAGGIQVKSILGNFKVEPLNVSDNFQELGSSDLIILAVKAWQIAEIREKLRAIVHQETLVLPLQNGVMAAEELSKRLDARNILGGICRIISKIESPGVINHFGATPSIVFGELEGGLSIRTESLKTLFDQAEINSKVSDNIKSDIWKKFGFICVGGLMAVSRCTLGELREFGATRSLIRELVTENVLLADKIGIDMGNDYVERTLSLIDSLPTETTFSMARDIWERRPSELDYLNGAVVQLGIKHGIDTPVNRFIYSTLLPTQIDP